MLGLAYRYKNKQTRDPKLAESEIVYFEKALELDHKYLPAIINLAYAFYSRGKKAEAAAWFKKALELHPNGPDKAQMEKMIAEGSPPPPPAHAKKRHGK
ncbi:MAG: tetratricopeptide repeat protein [Deltaproteobacteria bacterium]|nr:tetratricopeptide repeat protein [Deltaproteobacteria bacterium]